MSPETGVVSFVLRFVYDEPPSESALPVAGWHGVIRHVQSDSERHFTRWTDAVAFIDQFVRVQQENPNEP
jgi:hypothetical protein